MDSGEKDGCRVKLVSIRNDVNGSGQTNPVTN